MSYINRSSGQAKSGTWIAVAALHGAALYALINGLGIDYVKETIVNLPARNFERPPPPPAEKPPKPARNMPQERSIDTVRPVIAAVPAETAFELDFPVISPTFQPIGPVAIPDPDPSPHMQKAKPVSATPRTSPGNWVSANDYPTRDIRQGNEGTAVFRLAIDATGTVTDCAVTRSSGHPGLDEATCRKVSQRARFDPARDENGERRSGTYTGSIKWVIPR